MAFLFGVPPSEKLHLLFFFFFLDFLFFNSTPSWRDGRHFSLAVFVCVLLLFFFFGSTNEGIEVDLEAMGQQ